MEVAWLDSRSENVFIKATPSQEPLRRAGMLVQAEDGQKFRNFKKGENDNQSLDNKYFVPIDQPII